MEHVDCDFCGGSEFEHVMSQTDILHNTTTEVFSIVSCQGCGLQFVNPRPEEDQMDKYYSDIYSFHSQPGWIKRTVSSVLQWVANSSVYGLFNNIPGLSQKLSLYVIPKIEDPVQTYFKGGKILDIGCGSGVFAHFWGKKGSLLAYKKFADVYGVEISEKARDVLAQEDIPSYKSLVEVPGDLYFEIIRMNWSLEHVHSPSAYFEFISSHLKGGGKAIITVPNYDGLLYFLAKDCVEVPIHLYHFRVQDIFCYAEKFGLSVVEHKTFSYPQMFFFAASLFPQLKNFSPPTKILETHFFQKILNKLDVKDMGNDMIFVLEKSNTRTSE